MFLATDTPLVSPRIKKRGVVVQLTQTIAEAEQAPTLSEPLLKALAAVARQSFGRLLAPLSPDRTAILRRDAGHGAADESLFLRADPLLAGLALAAANAPEVGLEPVSTLPEAVERLGSDGTWSLLQASASSAGPVPAPFEEPAERLVAHSVAVASLARRLAREEGMDEDLAYTAGLLHDVGRGLMLHCVSRLSCLPEVASILAVHGIETFLDHPITDVIGRELARCWNVPEVLRDAVGVSSALRRPVGRTPAALVARAEQMLRGGVNQHALETGDSWTASRSLDSLRECPAVA